MPAWRGWATEGIKTAPTDLLLLADTGALPAATFEFRLLHWTAQGWDVWLERVAADGATVLQSQVIPVRGPLPSWIFELPVVEGQRLRTRAKGAGLAGDGQVSIFWRPVR